MQPWKWCTHHPRKQEESAAPQPCSGKELDTTRTLSILEQMFSRAVPHLHNRSAPLWQAQTDCVWHKSESVKSTQLATPALPWLWSVLCFWIPLPIKGNSAASLLLLGTRGKAAGWTGCCTVHLQTASNLWPCHFCTSLDLLGPLPVWALWLANFWKSGPCSASFDFYWTMSTFLTLCKQLAAILSPV